MSDKRFITKFIFMIFIPLGYIVSSHFLDSYNYTFTNLSDFLFFAAWFYCTVSTINQSIKNTKDDTKKIAVRFLSGWGVYLGVICIIIMLFITFIATISGSLDEKERFPTIKNEKAVSVTIFRYGTNYYKRKTIFIRSKTPFLVSFSR